MRLTNLLSLLKKLNKLELIGGNFDVIVKKAFQLVLDSPLTATITNKGLVVFRSINEVNSNFNVIASKNMEEALLNSFENFVGDGSIWSKVAKTKKIIFNDAVHSSVITKNQHGVFLPAHYIVPIRYNNEIHGFLILFVVNKYRTNNADIEILDMVSNTLELTLNKKKNTKYEDFLLKELVSTNGEVYFKKLAKFLSQELGMKMCTIGHYNTEYDTIKSIVFVNNQQVLPNIVYPLEGTPCKHVIQDDFKAYPTSIQELFPSDEFLKIEKLESYLGVLLKNKKKEPIGIINFLHDQSIDNVHEKLNIINYFVPRLINEVERNNFERKIIADEKKYRDVFEKFLDVFVRLSFSKFGKILIMEVTPSVLNVTGYEPSELIGKSINRIFNDQVQGDNLKELLFKNGKIKDYLISFKHKNNSIVYTEINAHIVHLKNEPTEIRLVLRDVTDKKKENIIREVSYLIAKKSQRRIITFKGLSQYIYKIIGNVIDTTNFSIALLNNEKGTIYFPIHVNQYIQSDALSLHRLQSNYLTEYFIQTKQKFVGNFKEISEIAKNNNLQIVAPIPQMWISVPIKMEGQTKGLITLKSYNKTNTCSSKDVEFLEFVATQLASILEKEQWQKSILEKEKYFRSLVEKSNEVTGIISKDGQFNYITESIKNILGYNSYELIGKNIVDFFPASAQEIGKENFSNILINNDYAKDHLVKVVAKNGDIVILEFTLNNQLTNPDIQGIIFNTHDVTARHYAEKELISSKLKIQEQTENYVAIFNNSDDGFLRLNSNSTIIESNPGVSKITGYSIKELINSSFLDMVEASKSKKLKIELKRVLKDKKDKITLESKTLNKKGTILILKFVIKPIFSLDSKLNYFIVFVSDITQRTRAIKKALDIEKALAETANILHVDVNGIITKVSNRVTLYSGYSEAELVGSHTRIFNSGYHSIEFFKEMWETITSGRVWNGEIRNKKKDGNLFWVFTTIIPILTLNKELDYFLVIRHDITQQKLDRVDRVREVIDAQEKEKESFAKELHDGLGQMLLAAKMNLGAIQDKIAILDDDTQEIYNNSLKLLTGAIVEARTVSHGLMTRVLHQFGLAYAVEDMINNSQGLKQDINFEFVHNIKEERYRGETEQGLYRVLQELVSNIIKHSKATKALVEIMRSNNSLNLVIKDNGVGIDNTNLQKKFNEGIGLKNITTRINYLEGTFEINKRVKQGTEIIINVPI